MSLILNSKSRPRDPPPVLFLHPTPGASHVSLSSTTAQGPLAGTNTLTVKKGQSNLERNTSVRSVPTLADAQRSGQAGSIRSTDQTDALWAEMQATLEEVELSASGGTHVFGPGHDRKLSDLRSSQIRLAQAWARSEADEAIGATPYVKPDVSAAGELRNMRSTFAETPELSAPDGAEQSKTVPKLASNGDEGKNGDLRQLEEETELEGARRAANDKYFQRVSAGVVDVVGRLEEVAVAMRAVEQESQDVWKESRVAEST